MGVSDRTATVRTQARSPSPPAINLLCTCPGEALFVSRLCLALVAACFATVIIAAPAAARAPEPPRVAIIVGPVGSLTPTYLALAEAAAAAAERHGATVARAYSPNATPANVLAAVADANVIVYFGHGYGHPSPYGGLDPWRQNGWGLQGPRARGTHADDIGGGLAYYGEEWIAANARPAPGFVMIYSNTCYAPGASEGGFAPATPAVAAERVAHYSRKVFRMGGSAYFATDFDRGAADLVDRLLGQRHTEYGAIFGADHRYVPSALSVQPHHFAAGQQLWLHRTKYTDGPPNYWYAFAGNPQATPIRSWDPVAPTVELERPLDAAREVDPRVEPKLRFSEPVRGVDAERLRLLDAEGRAVSAEIVHNAATGAVRIVPADELDLSARYSVALGAGIVDEAGNALAPASWSFVTRLDTDPLSDPVPLTLAPGSHRVVRLAADGSLEERELELESETATVAGARARLPDLAGSWFEIASGPHAGWWVAESPRARASGTTEEVSLPPTQVQLAMPEEPGTPRLDRPAEASASPLPVIVDRRAVVDGRTYLRVVGGPVASTVRWVEAPADLLPDGVAEQRILDRRARPAASLRLEGGAGTAVRLDQIGRVVEHRSLTAAELASLTTVETLVVSGRRLHGIGDGDLAGWAIVDHPGVSVVVEESRDPS